jgi:hypothetical protein
MTAETRKAANPEALRETPEVISERPTRFDNETMNRILLSLEDDGYDVSVKS